ncbi:MAG: CBS domain-containing protein [Thermodesulfobacteriota bacterium]|nr:CBS domain-containing protein [Thermodesulfobacteriota bacterium]
MELITTHINADFDCLGGMVAAKLLYPDALLVFAGAQEPALREFLKTATGRTIAFGRCKDIDFDAVTRLILVDVNRAERIGSLAVIFDRPEVELHVYDHHPPLKTGRQPTLAVVDRVGSTVTVMVSQLQKKALVPDADQATMMMLGLYEDTGNLLFSSTTEADYAAAAYLLRHGADLNQVADTLTRELSILQVNLLHQLLQSLQLLSVNGVDVYLAQAAIDCYVGDIAVLAHKIRDMENIDVLIVAVRLEDRVFLVGRSRIPDVHVGNLLAHFGGGGHASAASATLRDKTLVQVVELLPGILEQEIVLHSQARYLMSAPVRRIDVKQSLQQAREKLTRYHVNALAVVDDSSAALVGIVSRQIVERAVHHGLAAVRVGEYMTTEFGVAAPDSPLSLLQELVVGQHQRFVPVVDKQCLLGVVTRTDLLRHTVSQGRKLYRDSRQVTKGDGFSLNRRHVARLIDTRLPLRVRQMLKNVAQVADEEGLQVYAVGGFVRDLLLKKQNLDVDIVVEGNAIDFAHCFAKSFDCRVRSHEKFITAVVIFDDGFKLDVASTRTEHYLEPGALPMVEEASIKLDLYRRDFTINTLALSLNEASFGELMDPFGAQRDLHDRAIRVLHNLSFVEDPTRAFRAVRFEQRLGFKLGMHTERLLRSAVEMGFLERVRPLRLFNELMIIMQEDDPFAAVQRLDDLGLLQFLCAGFEVDPQLKEQFSQAGKAINWYELLYIGTPVEHGMVYFLCLSSSLDGEEMQQLCKRLTIPQRWEQLFVVERERFAAAYHTLERHHHRLEQMPASRLYHLLQGASVESLLFFMARTPHETVRSAISYYVTRLQGVKTHLDGDDLFHLGVERGPVMGQMLGQLLDARLEGVIITRQDEECFVGRLLGS